MRLASTVIFMPFLPASVIAYGWVCEKHVSVAAICVMLFLSGLFSMCVSHAVPFLSSSLIKSLALYTLAHSHTSLTPITAGHPLRSPSTAVSADLPPSLLLRSLFPSKCVYLDKLISTATHRSYRTPSAMVASIPSGQVLWSCQNSSFSSSGGKAMLGDRSGSSRTAVGLPHDCLDSHSAFPRTRLYLCRALDGFHALFTTCA